MPWRPHLGSGSRGTNEDDTIREFHRGILDSDLGVGGLLERLHEHVELVDDGAHTQCMIEETKGHVTIRVWSLVQTY